MSTAVAAHARSRDRPGAARPIDGLLVAGTLVASLALLFHGGVPALHSESQLDPLSAGLAAGATLPLLAWRRAPFAVFVAAAGVSALAAGIGYPFGIPLAAVAALYLLATTRDDLHPWTTRTTGTVFGLALSYLMATILDQGAFPASELLHVGLAWTAAWLAGERTRLRREHIADLEGRALRTERDAERERELAAAEERARIARDLHDSAGHAISVIAVRAGAARLRHDEDPERSGIALAEVEELARQTAAEIDLIVGALREDARPDRAVEGPPGLASMGALLKRHTSAGLEVELETLGAPRPLDGPVDVAAYRILQEALTNAARHGTGPARIELVFGNNNLELVVANPIPVDGAASPGGGHGIVGMRERAALLDGTLDADRSNGTFRLHAALPYLRQRA